MEVDDRGAHAHGAVELSRIACGTWRPADDPDGRDPRLYRQEIDALVDQGVTTLDPADLYGD